MKIKYAERREGKIHKRFYITKHTALMLRLMNELMQNDAYDDFVEMALLYGLAHLNDRNSLNFEKWTTELKLPTVSDIDDFYSPPKKLTNVPAG